ncbi:probable prolyl 4-hydroxylase 3 isoform X3 [Lactuca sativa]|uniref:probable prolyl 4-hydroxylase 3 isoform X3 n=1 Tax=Lactuca sativa TaxID=4236 RepID=UPI000CD88D7C|nr:probable prolyl 4-hydroxylase 3 isoform X3 [Lactuca sativa]
MDCVSKGRLTTVVAVWIRFGCEEGPTAYGAARESQQEFFRSAVSSERSFSVKGIGSGDDILFLSWKPRAFVYHNILSKEECDYLINHANPHMENSTIVDSKPGQIKDSRLRISPGTFLRRGSDKIIRDIEQRIADFAFIPVSTFTTDGADRYRAFKKKETVLTALGPGEIASSPYYRPDVENRLESV